MKRTVFVLLALTLAPLPALAAPVCLDLYKVLNVTPSQDGNALLFRMRDGQNWRNDLTGGCTDLQSNGFSWVLPGLNEICDNQQMIHVLRTGNVCRLGKFTPLAPSRS
jgi:hypothetical protein